MTAREFGAFVRDDDREFCSQDGRFLFGVVGSERAAVPVVRVNAPASLSVEIRRMLGLSGIDGPASLIGGGVGHFWSAAWSREPNAHGHLHAVRPLLRSAVREALQEGRHAVAPSVDAEDLAAFMDVSETTVTVGAAQPHYILHLRGARSLPELIAVLPKKARQTWLRDLSSHEAQGLSVRTTTLTAADCAEMAEAVVATSRRNGVQDHAVIAEWRLSGFLTRPGHHVISRISHGEKVMAYACWTEVGASVIAHTFAVADDVSPHREAYHHAFRVSVEYALSRGADRILYGAAHAAPKRARGCHEEPKWAVVYGRVLANG